MIRLPIRAIRCVLSLAKSEIGKAFAAGVVCGLGTDHLGEPVSPMGANTAEVDGDPLADISVLRDREKILAVYKGGLVATRMPF